MVCAASQIYPVTVRYVVGKPVEVEQVRMFARSVCLDFGNSVCSVPGTRLA
jgi:hypothetical protein